MSSRDTAIAAVDAYAVDQANQTASVVASTLQPQIISLTTQLATATRTVTADAATIAALRARLAALQPPTPAVPRFGLDISVNSETMTLAAKYAQVTAVYGTLGPRTKWFDGGVGWNTAYKSMIGCGYGKNVNEVEPVICSKKHTAASFNQLMGDMSKATKGTWWAVYYQEPEDDIKRGQLTVADYRAAYQSMDTLRKSHANGGQVKLLADLLGYQEEDMFKAGYDTATLCTRLPIDALGWDLYDDSWYTPSWDAAKHLAPLAAAAAKLGVPWCIPEFGVQVSTKGPDSTAAAAGRLQAVIDYCRADSNFGWLNYWEGKGSNGDWTLIGKAGFQVMQAAMAS